MHRESRARPAFTCLRVEVGSGIDPVLLGLGYRRLDRFRVDGVDRSLVLYDRADGGTLPLVLERRHAGDGDRLGLLVPQIRL
jgi:hypothetical protein